MSSLHTRSKLATGRKCASHSRNFARSVLEQKRLTRCSTFLLLIFRTILRTAERWAKRSVVAVVGSLDLLSYELTHLALVPGELILCPRGMHQPVMRRPDQQRQEMRRQRWVLLYGGHRKQRVLCERCSQLRRNHRTCSRQLREQRRLPIQLYMRYLASLWQ